MSSGSISVVYSHYLKNYYRSKSFYLMLFLDILILSLFTYFSFRYANKLPAFFSTIQGASKGNLVPPSLVRSGFNYIWDFVLQLLPVFAAVFFGSPALSSEIESRTAFNVFPLPVSRFVLHLGKFFAALSVTAVILGIFALGQFINFLIIYDTFEVPTFYISILLSIVLAFSILSITFLVSSIFNKNLYAYITVFLLYFLIFNAINIVFEFLYGYTPVYLLSNAASIVYRVYINFDPFSFSFSTGSISPAPTSVIILDVSIMMLYALVTLAFSLVIFDRREVK
jgi:ABC-2 type transport system permease protein